jgi:hypothetical protein
MVSESLNAKVHQAVSIITELLDERQLELGLLVMPYGTSHIVTSVLHPVSNSGFEWHLNKSNEDNEKRMLRWLEQFKSQ